MQPVRLSSGAKKNADLGEKVREALARECGALVDHHSRRLGLIFKPPRRKGLNDVAGVWLEVLLEAKLPEHRRHNKLSRLVNVQKKLDLAQVWRGHKGKFSHIHRQFLPLFGRRTKRDGGYLRLDTRLQGVADVADQISSLSDQPSRFLGVQKHPRQPRRMGMLRRAVHSQQDRSRPSAVLLRRLSTLVVDREV